MLINTIKSRLEVPSWAKLSESEYGELEFPCFEEAKKAGENPKEFAEKVSRSIVDKNGYIKRVDAMNGYVNMYLDVDKVLSDFPYASMERVENPFSRKNIRLEHTSVNPNKALHIGHMRNILLGEFVRVALERSGGNVLTTYFVEDTGTQVADILVCFKYLGKKLDVAEKFDTYCSKIYREVNERYEKEPALREKRASVLREIEGHDKDTTALLKKIVDKILAAQMDTLRGYRIKYDILDLESYILGKGIVDSAMKLLEEKGVAYTPKSGDNAGCLVAKLDGSERILRRSDGTSLYVAKDIAYAFIKHGVLDKAIRYTPFGKNYDGSEILVSDENGMPKHFGKFNDSITLVGSEQLAEQDVVREILRLVEPDSNYTHYSYELVTLSKNTAKAMDIELDVRFVKMSGRKGTTVEVDDLVRIIMEKLKKEAENGGRPLGDEDATKLAVNIVRYSLLKTSPNKMVVFDIDEATSLKGDTALYANYTYARGLNILKKAGTAGSKARSGLDEAEKQLAKKILFWEEHLMDSINNLKPNLACEYLHKLCDGFNSFYEANQVIGSDRESERLLLLRNVLGVMKETMELIGLFVIERV